MQLSFSYLQQFIVGDSNIHVDISSDYDGQKVLEVLHSMGSLLTPTYYTTLSHFHFSDYLLYIASRGVSKSTVVCQLTNGRAKD